MRTNYTLDLTSGLTQVLADGSHSYLYGLGRIGQQGPDGWGYHLGDALGSVRQIVDPAALPTYAVSYSPFGQELGAYGIPQSPYGFAGELTDPSGLVYLRARYYNPGLGRFFQPDPFAGIVALPSTIHPYLYGLNNPLLYTDPSGEVVPAIAIAIGVGALIGGAGGAISYVMSHPGARFGDYVGSGCFWRSVGIGAVAGMAASLVGWSVPALLPMLGLPASGGLAWSIGLGAATGSLSSGAFQVTTNLLTGTDWHEDLTRSMITGAISGGIAGAVGYGFRQWKLRSEGSPHRFFSARELLRRANEPGAYHNFPGTFDEAIYQGNRIVLSDNYILYRQQGSIRRPGNYSVDPPIPSTHVPGTFEIGVKPSISGKIEIIVHRFFRPER